MYQRDVRYPQGHLAFIASVPQSDAEGFSNWGEEHRHANVTPEGRFLVFESLGALTPDTSATGAFQIFRYDADQTAQEASENVPALVRVSIGDDGYNDNGNTGGGQARIVPSNVSEASAGPPRGDPTMSNDGSRVFFESPVGLTPRALNDVFSGYETNSDGEPIKTQPFDAENVYEWEQAGVGSCPAGQASGCVYLISDGHDVSGGRSPCKSFFTAVCLLGTDEEGKNVFFMTADQLVPKDTDTQVDIYDARICEPENGNPCITEPPPPLPPCDGESCHGIPEPTPSLLAPGSAAFKGEANIAAQSPSPSVKTVTKKAVKCRRASSRTRRISASARRQRSEQKSHPSQSAGVSHEVR